mmetsp:Transcript_3907/g.9093  ORF Transcript_3907/g.9093 Transcript_3907/m.9093 type:complete len:230 (+) Transcript_3907:76-765(+)
MAKMAKWKKQFQKLDINGDGLLSADELHSFLKRGNPEMTRRETEMLFSKVDQSGDGLINFHEFVDYVLGKVDTSVATTKQGERETHARHSVVDESVEQQGIDWRVVEKTFIAFAGRDGMMDGSEFARLCRQCELIDHKEFQSHDVEIVFAETCIASSRKLTKKEFRKAMKAIAKRKHCPAAMIRGQVAACDGPKREGVTKVVGPPFSHASMENPSSCMDVNLPLSGEQP